ncbi:MAG: amino acid racemase [Proteobacteria bacterium]|nr:amino acid racemase [Pseudomonadota bacterium]
MTTSSEPEKIVGIIGGLGPDATVDIMQRIIRLTPANDDIDHIRCIVDNNPKVPSRIKALIDETGECPGPHMAEMGKKLEQWGANFLIIPCNTAHYYYQHVVDAVTIPVINLIDLVVSEFVRSYPDRRKVGIAGSTAIIKTRLYSDRFQKHGIEDIYPDDTYQDLLLQGIKMIKAGVTGPEVDTIISDAFNNISRKGADVIIIACTELSVVCQGMPFNMIDAAEVLARETVTIVKQGKHIERKH